MAYPRGGRSDKYGNKYEYNWIIYQLLEIIEEEIVYVIWEDIGEDEKGIDLWVGNKDGSKEGQQCKGRNASKDNWTFSDAAKYNIFHNWKNHLEHDDNTEVSLVSPLSFLLLEDLTNAARNTRFDEPTMFVDKQIFSKNTGKPTQNLFRDICNNMEINLSNPRGKAKAQNFFSRIYYRQMPDNTLKDIILKRIDMLFVNEKKEVYSQLLKFILMEDNLGKKIDIIYINAFLKQEGIEYLDLAHDNRILPRINKLNEEFIRTFIPLSNGMIKRTPFITCQKAIEKGESIVIHGNAGYGKSGCTINIVQYCKDNDIPYLSVKLDKHVPEYNSKKWGEQLGLPSSVVHCINAISYNRKAILIFDQLDALRWTQSHSGDAISICAEIIDEVHSVNKRREKPISVVFVCRSYDLENDRSIKSLFENRKDSNNKWNKIEVGKLENDVIKTIIGEKYHILSQKQKRLLSVISNLYIWEQLENKDSYLEINTTYELINKWWNQILKRGREQGFEDYILNNVKNKMISFFDKRGSLFIPEAIINVSSEYLYFLKSNGFITNENKKLAFVHQSISDCFLSEIMLNKYFEGESVLQIIGRKDKQTPARRYQTQLFLQQLSEYRIESFLSAGEELISSEGIRYNFKFVFLEVMAHLAIADELIPQYVLSKMDVFKWKNHFLNCVVNRNITIIHYLRDHGVFDEWMNIEEEKENVIRVMASIAPMYNDDDISFIKKYAFSGDDRWSLCFNKDINEGNDDYFELRIQFYRYYPKRIIRYFNLKELIEICENRTIKLLSLMLELSIKNGEKSLYNNHEEFMNEDEDICIINYSEVFKAFIPLLPDKKRANIEYSEWSLFLDRHMTLERVCTNILKKALKQCAKENPELLIKTVSPYMNCGNYYYNELVLYSFKYLPEEKSDFVLSYLYRDFNVTAFEKTSGNHNMILLLKDVIEKHSKSCSDTIYQQLEYAIIHFISQNAKERLQHRININREKNGYYVFWNFWGDFQRSIMPVLPKSRLSKYAKEILVVLKRNRQEENSIYNYGQSKGGGVKSPISGKKLSKNSWKNIISNKKITYDRSLWKYKDGYFIENSLEEFSDSFRFHTEDNPGEALSLILEDNLIFSPIYVDKLWSGISSSKYLDEVPNSEIEMLIQKHGYNFDDYRARNICECIENKKDTNWSEVAIKALNEIAIKHKNPDINNPVVYSDDDKDIKTTNMLVSNSLNCVRGAASRAIGQILWSRQEVLNEFIEAIEYLVNDENPIVRYAALWAIWPSYNISREWALDNIFYILERDYRAIVFPDMRNMFCRVYEEKKEYIRTVINEAVFSNEINVLQVCGYCIAELYILHDEFKEYIENYIEMKPELRSFILEMIIVYFNIPNYHEKAKDILIDFSKINDDNMDESKWGNLFRNNLLKVEEDNDLIESIITSNIGDKVFECFLEYLDVNNSRKRFAKYILNTCQKIIEVQETDINIKYKFETTILKTIIGLYDETKGSLVAEEKEIASTCLDIWDLLYERDFGAARKLTMQLMDR